MQWYVFCGENILLQQQKDGTYNVPCGEQPPVSVPDGETVYTLPQLRSGTIAKTFMADTNAKSTIGGVLFSLKEAYNILSDEAYSAAVKSKEFLFWDKNTRFCSVCAAPMVRQTTISKCCTACGREVFTQIAPAVIVLIHRGEEIIMVHAHNFSGNFFALVAGFVETGETLEETVVRECYEELGVRVKNIRYVMSQAWPYPSNLMVGFIAEYDSGEITLQRTELAAGGWYDIHSLPTLPHPSGIAYKLIEVFKNENNKRQ